MNDDTFGDYFIGTGLVNRVFNVLIYWWFNEVTAFVLDLTRFIVRCF